MSRRREEYAIAAATLRSAVFATLQVCTQQLGVQPGVVAMDRMMSRSLLLFARHGGRGSYFPSLIEPRRRIDKALHAVAT